MEVVLYLLVAALLLLLNAFFVLSEFAAVRVRPTQIAGAGTVARHVQEHLDEYLSVCQLGITFASIGLGFVGEPLFARLLAPLLGSSALAHGVAIVVAYVLVSFLHIVIGELVPKSLAIRAAERAALATARPLRIFRAIFYPPLVVLNGAAMLLVRALGYPRSVPEERHTEEELKRILGRSESTGLLSFRRLLLMENVFELGDLRVRDVMRPREVARVLRADAPWESNREVIRDFRFSRYPLVGPGSDRPLGIVHVKDLLFEDEVDLRRVARAYAVTTEDRPLETLLPELQRRRAHMVIVLDRHERWTGFITLEDILEEIIGTIEDEFESEPPLFLADVIGPGRVVLDARGATIDEAVRDALTRVPADALPRPREEILRAILERERQLPTELGRGIAVPHARLDRIRKPAVVFARTEARDRLLFILLTPAATPRSQARLLARIGGLLDSEFVEERLRSAGTEEEILEAIRAGDPSAVPG